MIDMFAVQKEDYPGQKHPWIPESETSILEELPDVLF